jgi:hypothetical protein
MNLYLDESGDLGWTLDKPYQSGGSSRYLTIATLLIPKALSHLPKRIVRKIYKNRKQPTRIEIKGNSLSSEEKDNFIPDPRTIKISSGNSLIDYLQIKLWFEMNAATKLIYSPMESKSNLNLQFIDFICHIIWKKYEFNEYRFYSKIKPYISEKHLFF